VPTSPPSLSGVGLDEVREREAQRDGSLTKRKQFCTWPRKLVEIHVACFYTALVLNVFPKGLDFGLDN
jgi:hypothetical protein